MALKGGVLLLPQQVNWVSSRFLTVQVHNVRVRFRYSNRLWRSRCFLNVQHRTLLICTAFSPLSGSALTAKCFRHIYVVRTIPDFFSSSFWLVMPTYWKPYTMYVVCGGHLLRICTSTAQSSECGFTDNVSVSFNEGEDCVVL